MTAWRKASGLGLKVQKCVIIMLLGTEFVYQHMVDEHLDAAGMRIARAAAYLDVEVGPGGHIGQ